MGLLLSGSICMVKTMVCSSLYWPVIWAEFTLFNCMHASRLKSKWLSGPLFDCRHEQEPIRAPVKNQHNLGGNSTHLAEPGRTLHGIYVPAHSPLSLGPGSAVGEKGKKRGKMGKMATLSPAQTTPLGSLRSCFFFPFPPNAESCPRLKVTLQYGINGVAYTKTIMFLTV